jgi:hypothetical protein
MKKWRWAVDISTGAEVEAAPPDRKAKSHWRWRPLDGAVTTRYAVNETKLTLEAAAVRSCLPLEKAAKSLRRRSSASGKKESAKRVDRESGTAVGSAPRRTGEQQPGEAEAKERSGNGRLTAKALRNRKGAPEVEREPAEWYRQDGSTKSQRKASGSVFENQIASPKKTDCGNRSQFLRRHSNASRRESIGGVT